MATIEEIALGIAGVLIASDEPEPTGRPLIFTAFSVSLGSAASDGHRNNPV